MFCEAFIAKLLSLVYCYCDLAKILDKPDDRWYNYQPVIFVAIFGLENGEEEMKAPFLHCFTNIYLYKNIQLLNRC